MDRRAFITVVGGSILTAPFAGEAHQGVGPTKIGVLASASEKTSAAGWASFRQGLRDLGWEDGRNIVIEARFADGKLDRLRGLAEELLHLDVSLIVAANTPGASAAIAATKIVPIVIVEVGDPLATGFVTVGT